MTLGQRLKDQRLAAGYSQEKLAETLLVSRQTIINWEKDWNLPDLANLSRLADLYQLSLDELCGQEKAVQPALPLSPKRTHLKHYLLLLGLLLLGAVVSFQRLNLLVVLIFGLLLRYIWSEVYHTKS